MAIEAAELEACYQRVERPLHNVLYRWLWDAQACQDVMHDAFLRLWAQRERLAREGLDALVYTTALNLARNQLRWRRLRSWIGLETLDATTATHDSTGAVAEQQQLRRALTQLEESERNVILLSEFSGFDTNELAKLLDIAPGTVGSRRHRALAKLRRLMGVGDEA